MSIVPTPRQLAWQRAGFGLFCHFGVNTFHAKEWSDGTLPAASFDPSDLDARRWADAAAGAGAEYLVLTAKHHDGFCLWPTETTGYSVRSSPWRDGRGDVVGEVAEACRAAGIGFGVYLSPWDRNADCYADPAAYDDFYVRQLTELCTGYGELFEIWFDGAGSEGRTYDWDRFMDVVATHQPGAMVFNMGRPTIRWVGNEDGLAADPCVYAVAHTEKSMFTGEVDTLGATAYLPPECDVPIRQNWFWQPDDAHTLKSLRHLMAIHYRSVGLGAGLLLNVAPDRRGLFDDADAARLAEFGAELGRRFGAPAEAVLDVADGEVVARFGRELVFDHVELREDLAEGQAITSHAVLADGTELAAGGTVGVRRMHAVGPARASELRIRLGGGRLESVAVHLTGVERAEEPEEQPERLDGKLM
ncbi:alpha-L-fucosidase [Phytomonospora sp. NPDC050363]|uniref:alpha-L-fucosidase n=1 Tax=Phytomonospora sp. NPDC050363 TaxID=3155642 RepID=UPI0033F35FB4